MTQKKRVTLGHNVTLLERRAGWTQRAIDVFSKRKKISSTTSYVEFNNLTDDMINSYINDFNPLDKAGSYGIQELPDGYLDKYEGSFENIVGLSPESVTTVLKQLNYNPN